ncbi:uncharacterized protein [Antedon mediterranea]|uniref:uncharacterized protein n=1 Tax=Antedon mediterranea TaxID=105859 RepID=UPI003AF5F28F
MENENSLDDMTYLGNAKYGVKVERESLKRCEMFANNIEKLALSTLELVITKDQCYNKLTIYGHGKGNIQMDEAKRKALQSYLFNVYLVEEVEKVWDQVVKKLNDKIRAIRNKKYKI